MRTIIKGSEEESQDGNRGQRVPGFLTSEVKPKEEHSPQPAGAIHREDKSLLRVLSSAGKRNSFQVLDSRMKDELLKAFPAS